MSREELYSSLCYLQVCELTPEYDLSNVSAQVAATAGYEIMRLALNNVRREENQPISLHTLT